MSTTTAGPDGEFCFLLPVGDYVVKVVKYILSMCFVV